jgi:hypothetical protein
MVPTLNEKAVLDLDWDTLGIWGRVSAYAQNLRICLILDKFFDLNFDFGKILNQLW